MAAIPGSVPITGFIAPTDSADIFATQDETYNRGGFRSVADLTARDAITSDRRLVGMLVRVISTGKFYTLSGGILNSNWVEETFGGASGALIYQGDVDVPADFPTPAAVQVGDLYGVKTDVVDNDAAKTNTGQAFVAGELISWNGANWDRLNTAFHAKDVPYAGLLSSANVKSALDEAVAAITGGRVVLLQEGVPEIAGVRYSSYANAVTYIQGVDTPGYDKRWVVQASGTITTPLVTLAPYIYIWSGGAGGNAVFTGDFTDDNTSAGLEAYQVFGCTFGGIDPNRDVVCTDCLLRDLDTTSNSGRLILYSTQVQDTNPGSDISTIDLEILEGSQVVLQNAGNVKMWGDSYLSINGNDVDQLECYGGGGQVYLTQATRIGTMYLFGTDFYGYGFTTTVDTGFSQIINSILYQASFVADSITIDTAGVNRGIGAETITAINGGSWVNRGEIYDNSSSGLTATNVQDAIDELAALGGNNFKSNVTPVGAQDGVNTLFTIPGGKSYKPNSLTVFLNGGAYQPASIQENGPGYTTFNIAGGDTLPVSASGDSFWISYIEV